MNYYSMSLYPEDTKFLKKHNLTCYELIEKRFIYRINEIYFFTNINKFNTINKIFYKSDLCLERINKKEENLIYNLIKNIKYNSKILLIEYKK